MTADVLFKRLGITPNRLRWVIFVLFAALIACGKYFHCPWRDESDSWLTARDTTFDEFIHHFGYSGHPPLWYLSLLPFARVGLPYETMQVIHAVFVLGAAWLWLFRSPYPLAFSALYLFSIQFCYQYGVIARGYALMVLLLFAAAALYPARWRRPVGYGVVVALLSMTEAFMLAIAGMLGLLYSVECIVEWRRRGFDRQVKKGFIAGAIMLAGGLISLISLLPPADATPLALHTHHHARAFFQRLCEGLWPGRIKDDGNVGGLIASPFLLDDLSLLILGLTLTIIWHCRAARLLFIVGGYWFYYIFTWRYAGYFWHAALFYPFLFFCGWIARDELRFKAGADRHNAALIGCALLMTVSLLISDAMNVPAMRQDAAMPASGGKDMAEFIRDSQLDTTLIATDTCQASRPVMAYLPHTPLWVMLENRYSRYVSWNKDHANCYHIQSASEAERHQVLAAWQYATYRALGDSLLLTSRAIPEMDMYYMHIRWLHTSYGYKDKYIYLYQLVK